MNVISILQNSFLPIYSFLQICNSFHLRLLSNVKQFAMQIVKNKVFTRIENVKIDFDTIIDFYLLFFSIFGLKHLVQDIDSVM
jgi:hypothetical protein